MASHNTGAALGLPESHRNSPLAPSQEVAYRQKCIELKRRLSEIEANNDSLRQRLTRERHFQDKMRLNRAILLNHMKELIENPSKHYGQDTMNNGATQSRSRLSGLQDEKGNGFMFDDTSEISSSDEVQEVHNHFLKTIGCASELSLIVFSQRSDLYVSSVPATVRLEHRWGSRPPVFLTGPWLQPPPPCPHTIAQASLQLSQPMSLLPLAQTIPLNHIRPHSAFLRPP
jgi:hypothetical protein